MAPELPSDELRAPVFDISNVPAQIVELRWQFAVSEGRVKAIYHQNRRDRRPSLLACICRDEWCPTHGKGGRP